MFLRFRLKTKEKYNEPEIIQRVNPLITLDKLTYRKGMERNGNRKRKNGVKMDFGEKRMSLDLSFFISAFS